MSTRRRFLQLFAGAATAGTGLGLYAWRIEPHWVELTEPRLAVPDLPERWAGTRLLQLSDIHIGPRVDDDHLRRWFDRCRELKPDIVALTGDFISHLGEFPPQAKALLRRLPKGRVATVACMGNHDYGPGWRHLPTAQHLLDLLGEAGVTGLRNEKVEIDGLELIGMDDYWGPRFSPHEALADHRPGASAIVLCHNPDAVDAPGWESFQGPILAGHTHGGQCRPPFLPAPILPVRNKRYAAGRYDLFDGRELHISRGLGHLLQLRFNVRPEVTLFTLERRRT